MATPTVGFSLPEGFVLGGVQAWSIRLCRQLLHRNHKAVLFEHASEEFRRAPRFPPPSDVPVISCTANRWCEIPSQHLAAYQSILPAVFLPNSRETFAACALLSRSHGPALRVLGFCFGCDAMYFSLLREYEAILHRFVAVSEECGAALRRLLPYRQEDIVVKPCGIDYPAAPERAYSVEGEPLRLLYNGRLEEREKRASDLLRLAERLARRGVDFHLRIVGEGGAKPALRRRLGRLAAVLGGRVTLESAVPLERVPDLYRQADVSLLVSAVEGTSLVMLEAMAHGCVPVVTRVSGTAAVIREGETGYAVPVGDVAAMSAVVERLAGDRAALPRLGRAARAQVEPFSNAHYLPWFERLLDEVWEQAPRAWPAHRPVFKTSHRLLSWFVARTPGGVRLTRFLQGR